MNIAVIYGGSSCERDVSVITALQAMEKLDKTKYEIYPVMLKESGGMLMPHNAEDIRTYITEKIIGTPVFFRGRDLCRGESFVRRIAKIDCALICAHGAEGENGVLQGFLQLCGIPYSSPGVEASAVCMNKITSKSVFASLGIDVLSAAKVERGGEEQAHAYAREIGYPVIVKPARQGSSIGIDVARSESELDEALAVAFEFDPLVLIERALEDFTEINCACVKSRGEIIVSSPERPLSRSEILTYEDKYLSGGKMSACGREFPAKLSEESCAAVQNAAATAYKELEMRGVVRFDFLIDKGGKIYLNEANTVPGSLADYLFTDKGIDGCRLMDILIEEACADTGERRGEFSSNVLRLYSQGVNACKTGGGHI